MPANVSSESRPLVGAALLATAAFCAAVTGYSFMAGNHEVYLLAPMRVAGLASFAGDWFVNDTLQYHGLFSLVAAALFEVNAARGGFLVIYFALALTLAWGWWRIVRAFGGGVSAFLTAVLLYHVLLGDRALGFYSLLQDGQFNAGNVAAVALVVGLAMWLEGRLISAGLAFGVAGAFHLNYAVVGPALWVALIGWSVVSRPARGTRPGARPEAEAEAEVGRAPRAGRLTGWLTGDRIKPLLVPSALAVLPSVVNIGFALPAKFGRDGDGGGGGGEEPLPFGEFVDLYVHLRHPHHYDPLAWPWWVWAAFLIPIPLAIVAFLRRGRQDAVWARAAQAWAVLMALQVAAFVAAGLFWLTETAIQMSLWRFSCHAKLLATAGIAVWLVDARRRPRAQAIVAGVLLVLALVAMASHFPAPPGFEWFWRAMHGQSSTNRLVVFYALLTMGLLVAIAWILPRLRAGDVRRLGLLMLIVGGGAAFGGTVVLAARDELPAPAMRGVDPALAEAAAWARANTAEEAVFLVPPGIGSAWPIQSRRPHVVSFKLVPQLSDELGEWDERLRDVLAVQDLSIFAGGFTGYGSAQRAMDARYGELSAAHLFDVAGRYGARYVLTVKPLADVASENEVWRGEMGAVVYDARVRGE